MGEETPTTGRGSRTLGIVSGHVVMLARRAAGDTQEALAEALGVDTGTVQGWESGRRPLTALRAGDLVRLRMRLVQRGAPASLARHLGDALEADLLLSTAVDSGPSWDGTDLHPLGAAVHRRALTNMVTWALTGDTPNALRAFSPRVPQRGPSPNHPTLYADERVRFFDHLLVVAERATPAHALLRRQAIYLLGFDTRPDTMRWLRGEWHRAVRLPGDDLHGIMGRRSAAVAQAALGDRDSLNDFTASLGDERADTANLNYWAHWVGELPGEQHDDTFMTATDPRSWAGLHLAEHLIGRLDPASPHLALNLATMHALVASRPGLLGDRAPLRTLLGTTLARVGAADTLTGPARDQLAGLAYAVRLANR